MALIVILLIILYVSIGSALGGYYYYLRRKEKGLYHPPDMEDMAYLPIWIAFLWVFVAPLAFAIYYAQKRVERDEKQ